MTLHQIWFCQIISLLILGHAYLSNRYKMKEKNRQAHIPQTYYFAWQCYTSAFSKYQYIRVRKKRTNGGVSKVHLGMTDKKELNIFIYKEVFKAKFHEKLFRSVRDCSPTNSLSSTIHVFIFGQIFKFKTGHNSPKSRIKLSCEFASIFIFYFLSLWSL